MFNTYKQPEYDWQGKSKEEWALYFLEKLVQNLPLTGKLLIEADAIPDLTSNEIGIFRLLNQQYEIQNLMIDYGYVDQDSTYSKPVTNIGREAKKAGGHFAYQRLLEQRHASAPVIMTTIHGGNSGHLLQGNQGNLNVPNTASAPSHNMPAKEKPDAIIKFRNGEWAGVFLTGFLAACGACFYAGSNWGVSDRVKNLEIENSFLRDDTARLKSLTHLTVKHSVPYTDSSKNRQPYDSDKSKK